MSGVFNSTGHELLLPDVVSGEGIHLTDADGNRYADFTSGVWCAALGHRNRRVNDAMAAQLGILTHAGFSYSNPVVEEAAAAVLSVCGFDDGAAVFLCSGSEGIEYARQASRKITGRRTSITFHDTYLGSFAAVVERGDDWVSIDWEHCDDCPGGNRKPDCDHLAELPDEVSEFLLESGSSAGQVRFAPGPFVRRVVDRVRAVGGIVIANEVTTGIGRTGAWFGFQHHGIEPDVVVMGKGLGNGYPVSAVVMTRRVADALAATDFRYMQSHQNDPLGAAVAREVVTIIEDEGLIDLAAANGVTFVEALEGLRSHPRVRAVRGRGLMAAVDLSDDEFAGTVFRALLERGYIVCRRGATLRIDPPLITEASELAAFVTTLDSILESS